MLPTDDLTKYFNEYTLAYWFMGDGYLDVTSNSFIFCTDSFSYDEVVFLCDLLKDKFDIKASPNKRTTSTGIKCHRMRVLKISSAKFVSLVKPHVIPVFHYKLNLAYQKSK